MPEPNEYLFDQSELEELSTEEIVSDEEITEIQQDEDSSDTSGYDENETSESDEENLSDEDEELSEDNNVDTTDATDEEYVKSYTPVEVPDNIPDFYKPTTFKTQKEELAFYRERYSKALQIHNDETFKESFLKAYEDELLKREEEAELVTAVAKAVKEDPETLITMLFPQAVKGYGLDPFIKVEQADTLVDKRLQKEFGANYKDYYREEDANKEGTISYKMYKSQEQFYDEIYQHNEAVKQELIKKEQSQQQQQAPIDIEEMKEKIYNEHFKPMNLKKEAYDKFTEWIQDYRLNPVDLYKVYNFDKIIERIKTTEFEKGKKSILEEIKKQSISSNDYFSRNEDNKNSNDRDEHDYYRSTNSFNNFRNS